MAATRTGTDPQPGTTRTDRGFALLVVLWIFIILFAVGAEFSGAMRQDVTATMNFAGETQSYYLATAAANRTFFRALIARDEMKLTPQSQQSQGQQQGRQGQQQGRQGQQQGRQAQQQGQQGEEEEVPLVQIDGQWHSEQLWGAPVWVRINDESGKIPINLVTEGLLRQILVHLGVETQQAAEISAAILDWRDQDDEERVNGAESDYYLGLAKPYVAKNARIDSLEELLLVKGVTWDLYHGGTADFPIGLKKIFTIFNPRPVLNVRSSPPEVLRALFGLDEDQIAQLTELRAAGTGGSMLSAVQGLIPDPNLGDLLTDEPPNVLMVDVQAQMPDSPVAAHVGAVVDLGESNEGVYILRWYDQLPAADVHSGPAAIPGAA